MRATFEIGSESIIAESMVATEGIDNREPGQSWQHIAFPINGKEARIAQSPDNKFVISYDGKNYTVNLYSLRKVTQNIVVCLAKHAIRLKKDISFVHNKSDILNYNIELKQNEILFSMFDTENYTAKLSRIKNLEFPNKKIKSEDIEAITHRRMRIYCPPIDREKIGYEFKDLKNNHIAYMSNTFGAILLLWNILSPSESPEEAIIVYLDYILTNYSAKCDETKIKAIKRLEQEREKRRKIEYATFIENMFSNSIEELRHRMNRTKSDIDSHMRGLLTKEKEVVRDTDFLEKLKNRSASKEIKNQLEADYKLISQLRKTNKYTNFRFDSGSIVGRTSMIKFFDKYQIGVFDVYLSLNGVVKCLNKTYTSSGNYDHPHVSHGNPCWGNLGDAVFKMLRSNQFGAAFDVMYEFLMRYTDGRASDSHNKPYRRLEEWNPTFREQGLAVCRHCNRIKELCRCEQQGENMPGHCFHCHTLLANCQCPRCPAEPLPNNLLSFHIDCNPDCEHWNEEEEICGY